MTVDFLGGMGLFTNLALTPAADPAFDPAKKTFAVDLSNENMVMTLNAATWGVAQGNTPIPAGADIYFEATVLAGAIFEIGVGRGDIWATGNIAGSANAVGYRSDSGNYVGGWNTGGGGGGYSSGDTIGVAVRRSSEQAFFSRNGVWLLSSNPATGANPVGIGLNGEIYPTVSAHNTATSLRIRFSNFLYPAPAGFSHL